jgi:hypothetical protein
MSCCITKQMAARRSSRLWPRPIRAFLSRNLVHRRMQVTSRDLSQVTRATVERVARWIGVVSRAVEGFLLVKAMLPLALERDWKKAIVLIASERFGILSIMVLRRVLYSCI